MVTAWAYTAFVGALGLERLYELRLSRRNAASAFARGAIEHGRGHFRVMSALHTAFLASCVAEVWLLHRGFPGASGWLFLAGALLAQSLRYWAIGTLGDRWNVRVIVEPESEPVTRGPYRFVRHPNYLAVVLEILCVPLVHGAYLTAIFFSAANAVLLTVRIRAEERALGSRYASTFRDRPRFLPRVGRAH